VESAKCLTEMRILPLDPLSEGIAFDHVIGYYFDDHGMVQLELNNNENLRSLHMAYMRAAAIILI
jgi:hypothetical protein